MCKKFSLLSIIRKPEQVEPFSAGAEGTDPPEAHGFIQGLAPEIGRVGSQLDAAHSVGADIFLCIGNELSAEMLPAQVFPDGNAETGDRCMQIPQEYHSGHLTVQNSHPVLSVSGILFPAEIQRSVLVAVVAVEQGAGISSHAVKKSVDQIFVSRQDGADFQRFHGKVLLDSG